MLEHLLAGLRRHRTIVLGAAALVILSALAGTLYMVTSSGSPKAHNAASHHRQDVTPSVSPTTAAPTPEYAAASSGNSGQSATNAPSTAATTAPASVLTTTTQPSPPPCQSSNFTVSAATDKSAYSIGEPVQIFVTVTNTGPACSMHLTETPICPGAEVKDASGQTVWTTSAVYLTGCPAHSGPATVLPTGWSQQWQFTWQQNPCTSPENCSGQVPPGRYEVYGNDGQYSAPVPVTITRPATTTTTSTSTTTTAPASTSPTATTTVAR